MTNKTVEAVARVFCFADNTHIGKEGEIVSERGCQCKTEEDCFEINGPFRREMLGQARAVIAAYPKILGKEGKRIITEVDLQELMTSRKVYEG